MNLTPWDVLSTKGCLFCSCSVYLSLAGTPHLPFSLLPPTFESLSVLTPLVVFVPLRMISRQCQLSNAFNFQVRFPLLTQTAVRKLLVPGHYSLFSFWAYLIGKKCQYSTVNPVLKMRFCKCILRFIYRQALKLTAGHTGDLGGYCTV